MVSGISGGGIEAGNGNLVSETTSVQPSVSHSVAPSYGP